MKSHLISRLPIAVLLLVVAAVFSVAPAIFGDSKVLADEPLSPMAPPGGSPPRGEPESVCYDHSSPIVVTETVVDLGGGLWEYSYSFTNTEPFEIWFFMVWTDFPTSSVTPFSLTNWSAISYPVDTVVFSAYDARNLDPSITWVSGSWGIPWPNPSYPIPIGDSVSGFSFIANVFDTSAKLFAYEQVGFHAGPSDGCVAAVGRTRFLVTIDIKPGSYPNCFNINGSGVIPVAILGDVDLDVNQVDVETLDFAGLDVQVKGNGVPQCSIEDVSGDFTSPEGTPDGYDDLVCQFADDSTAWSPNDSTATLAGYLFDGTPIIGTDEICIRPARTPS